MTILCFATAYPSDATPLRIIAMPSPDFALRCIATAMQVGGAICLRSALLSFAFPPLYSPGLCPCHSRPFNAFADQGASLHIHSCDLRNFSAAGQLCAGPRRFVAVQNHASAIPCCALPLRIPALRCRCVAKLSISAAILSCAMQCLCRAPQFSALPYRCRSVHYSSAPWRCRTMHYRTVPLLFHSVHIHSRALPRFALPRPSIALPCLCDAYLR